MQYNFDEIIERKETNALNIEGFRSYLFQAGPEKEFPFADDAFIRMWVADMEFATPLEVREAIKNRVDKRIFGYTQVFDSNYYEAFSGWCKRLYDWEFPREELRFSPGIIPALYQLVGDILEPDEKMIINTPAYGFFKHSATYNNREIVYNDLKNDYGYFTIDFEDLEKKAADPKTKLLLWCNPHNPTGRMWTEEELRKVADIIEKYDLWVISDEIHCDLIRQDKKHIPMGKIMPKYNKLITCMAASKTFNMAGLMFSNIIIRDSKLRQTFKEEDKNVGFVNPLSLAANQAAYEKGGEWLEQLKSYLDHNFQYVKESLRENLPKAEFHIPEATYLAWIDLGNCIPDIDDLATFFANEAGVLLEGGDDHFVGNSEGFIRLNLAMPKATIEEGLKRIVRAIHKHNEK